MTEGNEFAFQRPLEAFPLGHIFLFISLLEILREVPTLLERWGHHVGRRGFAEKQGELGSPLNSVNGADQAI